MQPIISHCYSPYFTFLCHFACRTLGIFPHSNPLSFYNHFGIPSYSFRFRPFHRWIFWIFHLTALHKNASNNPQGIQAVSLPHYYNHLLSESPLSLLWLVLFQFTFCLFSPFILAAAAESRSRLIHHFAIRCFLFVAPIH